MSSKFSRRFFSNLPNLSLKNQSYSVIKRERLVQRTYCQTEAYCGAENVNDVVNLNHVIYESERKSQKSPLVLIHGLLGSAKNWHSFARTFCRERQVVTLDTRCHGQSPTTEKMDYFLMSEDVKALIRKHRWKKVSIVGHSMGGKIAMVLALTQPNLIDQLIIADANPDYSRSGEGMIKIVEAMKRVRFDDSGALPTARREASEQLKTAVPSPGLRNFLITNVCLKDNRYCFRVDPDVILANMGAILEFPYFGEDESFLGRTLFIGGANSNYVSDDPDSEIRRLFPTAEIKMIADAGHWVHSDQPKEFIRTVQTFLGDL